MSFHLYFDQSFYDDIPPEEKSPDELVFLVLMSAGQGNVVIKKYTEPEINRCDRKLIEKGIIRGTIFDSDKCSWSKLTPKGRLYFNSLLKKEKGII